MKRILQIAALTLAVVPSARADLTLEQEMDGGPQQGKLVMRVKGEKFRLDMPGGTAGPVSTIVDIKTGDTITLLHDKKIAIARSGAELKQAQEAKAKAEGADPSKKADPPKPQPANKTEKIGEYDADVYTLSQDDTTETLWIVSNFPHFPAIREDLLRLSQASAGGIHRAGTLDVATLPGMVVKRQKERGGQKMTITLTNVSQSTIEDSVFERPDDYKPVTPPPLAPAK